MQSQKQELMEEENKKVKIIQLAEEIKELEARQFAIQKYLMEALQQNSAAANYLSDIIEMFEELKVPSDEDSFNFHISIISSLLPVPYKIKTQKAIIDGLDNVKLLLNKTNELRALTDKCVLKKEAIEEMFDKEDWQGLMERNEEGKQGLTGDDDEISSDDNMQ